MRIGVAGLGVMGAAVAARLMEVGHEVTVWNRTPEKTKPSADAGAKVAATPADLERAVLMVRSEHPTWGGRKIHHALRLRGVGAPQPSTITGILHRHGMPVAWARHHDVERPRAEPQQSELGELHIELARLRLRQDRGAVARLDAAALERFAERVDPLSLDAVGEHGILQLRHPFHDI